MLNNVSTVRRVAYCTRQDLFRLAPAVEPSFHSAFKAIPLIPPIRDIAVQQAIVKAPMTAATHPMPSMPVTLPTLIIGRDRRDYRTIDNLQIMNRRVSHAWKVAPNYQPSLRDKRQPAIVVKVAA